MNVQSYLERIGIDQIPTPDLESLQRLQLQHLFNVPFENLNIHWGVPIELILENLFHKIVVQKRGGFCYELNGLFHWLLTEIGYEVERLSAEVYDAEVGKFGPAYDHMTLLVHLDDDYLVDVGFGDSFRKPLKFLNKQIEDVSGRYRIVERLEDGFVLEQSKGDGWTPQYRFTITPRTLDEFVEMCHFHQTSPDSHFTQRKICSIAKPWGRLSLSSKALITTRDAQRSENEVRSKTEFDALLLEHFGIEASRRET